MKTRCPICFTEVWARRCNEPGFCLKQRAWLEAYSVEKNVLPMLYAFEHPTWFLT